MTDWRAVIADLRQRREAIDQAIQTIEAMFSTFTPIENISVRTEPPARRPRKPRASAPTPFGGSTLSAEVSNIQARDAAIKFALRTGPRPSSELIDALPREPGQTPEQRESALRNALSRLKVKKEIKQVAEGWALA